MYKYQEDLEKIIQKRQDQIDKLNESIRKKEEAIEEIDFEMQLLGNIKRELPKIQPELEAVDR